MSYPPTEVGNVSNNSLFEDSIEFDAAEKPAPDGRDFNEPPQSTTRCAPMPEVEDDVGVLASPPTDAHIPVAPPSAIMKPRRTATAQPVRWEPVTLQVPDDDADDEFDIASAMTPVYHDADHPKPKVIFEHGEPDLQGEITNCFDEPGLLYRIVDKKNKTWAFYNDSLAFEVHVTCTFGKHSKVEALENTTLTRNDEGEFLATVIVYPGETELFVKGFVNGFTSKLRALPLSDEYFQERTKVQYEKTILPEIEAVRAIAGDETDVEAILQLCIEHNVPFVDLTFPPEQPSIDYGATVHHKEVPWARPSTFLAPELQEQVRLFRHPIRAEHVDQGELGNCWLVCAIATLTQNPNTIMGMFRHPNGAEQAKRERAVGAYRVTFNKNGLWRSIVVDDYLPVVAGTPTFMRSCDPAELWPAILEKAFAKLHRSYAMIQSGDPVHALTDMTGCPSMRFDDAFGEAVTSGADPLFHDWLSYYKAGYQIILTTPAKAPAINPGSHNKPDYSEDPELEKMMRGTGLLTGHAYTVVAVHQDEETGAKLVKIRNPWPYGPEWEGDWSNTSELWDRHPRVATAVSFDSTEGTSSYWMPWSVVLKYFNGGGVHFTNGAAYDVRIPLTFADCRPSVVLEVHVNEPTTVCFMLSNIDHRGIQTDRDGAVEDDHTSTDYPPLMLSLATSNDAQDPDVYRVILNTSVNTLKPSEERWTFLQAREISMIVTLEPKETPYLLIPRMMETEATVGSGEDGTRFEEAVHPIHFLNNYDKIFPDGDNADKKEVPVTLSVRSDGAFGADGGRQVLFKLVDGANSVFENFPKFPVDDMKYVNDVYFQIRKSEGLVMEQIGGRVQESAQE